MNNDFLNKTFEEQLSEVNFLVEPEDYQKFEGQIFYLETLSKVQNSSVVVFDFYRRNYAFKRIHFAKQFGHDQQLSDEMGFAYNASLVHPDDSGFILESYIKALGFIGSLPAEERKDYKLSYTFRTKDKTGNYHWAIDQVVVLELDRNNNIWLLLGITDILTGSAIQKTGRQLVNIKSNELYLFIEDSEKSKPVLSAREIEVLGLVSQGLPSKQIAGQLFISVNTVNNHRQNILEKTKTCNSAEAIVFAKNLGLI